MTLYTTNYNLDKYEGSDKPNLRDQYNSAMDKIDNILNTNATTNNDLAEQIETEKTQRINQAKILRSDINNNTTDIENLTKRVDINTNTITSLNVNSQKTEEKINTLIKPAAWTVVIDEDFNYTIAPKTTLLITETFSKRIGAEIPAGYAILSLLERSFSFPEDSTSPTDNVKLNYIPFDTFYSNPDFTDPMSITIRGGLLCNRGDTSVTTTKISVSLVFRLAKVFPSI